MEHPYFFIFLLVLNIPLYIVVGALFFGDLGGLFEALRYWNTPDIISAVRGNYEDDRISQLKLLWFVAICGVTVYLEYYHLAKAIFGSS
jgi:hypothetical protein